STARSGPTRTAWLRAPCSPSSGGSFASSRCCVGSIALTAPNLSRLQARHWALVALFAAAAAALGLSLFVYEAVFRLVVKPGRSHLAIALLSVKLLAFLGLGWMAFNSGRDHRPDPLGFAAGVTCLPLAAVWEAWRTRARAS